MLAIGTDGNPILFKFNTKTFDVELGNINTIGARNVLSYGGNLRYNTFDLSIAPAGDSRQEIGGYVQDEMFLHDKFRLNVGARIDKFDNIADAVFSPRVAAIFMPEHDHAIRVSYNKAFRSPSLVNNYIDTTIINQINLGLINPALTGQTYNFPVRAIGNQDLSEESVQSYEVGYTGIIRKSRHRVGGDLLDKEQERNLLHADRPLSRDHAAAGMARWPSAWVLEVLPPPCTGATCTTGGLPSEFSYLNLGEVKNKGLELGIDGAVNKALNVFANYSYQAEPDSGLRQVRNQPAADESFQHRLQLQPGPLSRQRVGRLRRSSVLPGRARRALRGPDRGVHTGQRRVRHEVHERKADDDDQGDQPAE